jgi:F-type H+-transporting ATPase subunit b
VRTLTDAILLAAEEEPSPLVPHLSELIVGLVAFTLLFLFLRAKVFPVFERTFAERTAAIEGGIAKAEQAQAEAAEALKSYNAQLAEARGEAGRIRTEAQGQRAQIVEEARAEARAEAQRILESAQAQIASERQQALAELRREVGGLAVQLASKVVGESLEDEARQRRTVERFLDDLDSTSATTSAGTAS